MKREISKTVSVYFCEWNVLILRHVFKHYSSYALYVLFKYIVFCLNWYSIIKAGIICILFSTTISHILRSTRFANLPWVPVVCYWSLLAQVTQVKPRIFAIQHLALSTPSQFCETSLRWKLLLFLNASYIPQILLARILLGN